MNSGFCLLSPSLSLSLSSFFIFVISLRAKLVTDDNKC